MKVKKTAEYDDYECDWCGEDFEGQLIERAEYRPSDLWGRLENAARAIVFGENYSNPLHLHDRCVREAVSDAVYKRKRLRGL